MLWPFEGGLEPCAIRAALTLLIANLFELSSISTMGSAGFFLIFAAVNAANALHARHTKSRQWISSAGMRACVGALAALLWQTLRASPRHIWVLVAMVGLAVVIEGSYRVLKRRTIRLSR